MKLLSLAALAFFALPAYAAGPCFWSGGGTAKCPPIHLSELPANGTNYVELRAADSIAATYTMKLPADIGTAGYVLQTDGVDTLTWAIDSFALPVFQIENYDPNNTSSTRFYIQSNVNPSVDSSASSVTEAAFILDATLTQPMSTLRGIDVEAIGHGDQHLDSITGGAISSQFGNNVDAQTVDVMTGLSVSTALLDSATATSTYGLFLNVGATSASLPGDVSILSSNLNLQAPVTGSVTGFNVGGNATDISANLNQGTFVVNVSGDIDGSVNGVSVGGNVGGTIGGFSKWYSASGSIGAMNGGSVFANTLGVTSNTGNLNGYEDSLTIGTTDSYVSINAHPSITTSANQVYGYYYSPAIGTTNGGAGVYVGGTVDTSTAGLTAFEDATHVDTNTTSYTSMNLHPQVDGSDGAFTGILVQPNATYTGGGTQTAYGLKIDMDSVSNYDKIGLQVNARQNMSATDTLASGEGVNILNQDFVSYSIPDATNITGTMTFAHNYTTRFELGDAGSSLDLGPFGIGSFGYIYGFNPKGVPASGSISAYSNITSLYNPDGGSSGGTVDNVTLFNALGFPGGTFSATTLKAFNVDFPGGLLTTGTTFGFYSPRSDVLSYFRGDLKLGGASDTSSSGAQLEVEGDTYFNGLVGIGTDTPAESLSVGPASEFAVDSTGDLVSINAVAYTWPASQGAANTFLKNDGAGALTWDTPGSSAPGDIDGAVQFNDAGTFGGDAANFFWDKTNFYLGLGTAAPEFPLHIVTSGTPTRVVADGFGIGNTPIFLGRAALGTIGAPTAVAPGTTLAAFGGRGYGATGFSTLSRGQMQVHADEIWSDTAQGTYLQFFTTLIGTTTTAEKMRITDNGRVGIGTTTPGVQLDVQGQINAQDIFGNNGNASQINLGNSDVALQPNGTTALIAKNGGDVGIGDTTPDAHLDVQGDSDEIQVQVTGHSTQTSDTMVIEKSDGTDYFRFRAGRMLMGGATDLEIDADTSDASDDKSLALAGGGTTSGSRGGVLALYGNEYTTKGGRLELMAGNSSSAAGTNDAVTVTGYDSAGAGSNTTLMSITPTRGTKIRGTQTNDDAATGFVGESATANSAGVNVSCGNYVNVTSVSLTAGDWDVQGMVSVTPGTATAITGVRAAISTSSAAADSANVTGYVHYGSGILDATNSESELPTGARRISISGTTTVYLVAQLQCTTAGTGTFSNLSAIRARRMR